MRPPVGLPLCAVLLISSCSPELPAPPASHELVGERTLYARTYANPDGTTTYQVASGPRHYYDAASESWREIDTAWRPEGGGWINDTNNFPVRLPRTLGGGEQIALGPDLGIRWTPGSLSLRVGRDGLRPLADPSSSRGRLDGDEVIYADLYPHMDLVVRLAPGALYVETRLKAYELELTPEEFNGFTLEASIQAAEPLLDRLRQEVAAAEDAAGVPTHFGLPGEESAIALAGSPDGDVFAFEPEPLDEALGEATAGEGWTEVRTSAASAFDGWRTHTGQLLDEGRLQHHLSYSYEELAGAASTSAHALTAAFTFVADENIQTAWRFRPLAPVGGLATVVLEIKSSGAPPDKDRRSNHVPKFLGRIFTGRVGEYAYRTWVFFPGMDALRGRVGAAGERIQRMSLGFRAEARRTPPQISVFDTDYIWAAGLRDVLERHFDPKLPCVDPFKNNGLLSPVPNSFKYRLGGSNIFEEHPYTLTERYRAFGRHLEDVGAWAPELVRSPDKRRIGGLEYTFAPMSGSAPRDLAHYVNCGSTSFPLVLLTSYDHRDCLSCTRSHARPEVRKMNGRLLVGAELEDLMLEVVTEKPVTRRAHIEAVTLDERGQRAPNRDADLYLGGRLEFEVKLLSLSDAPSIDLSVADVDDLYSDFGLDVSLLDGARRVSRVTLTPARNVTRLIVDRLEDHLASRSTVRDSKIEIELTGRFPAPPHTPRGPFPVGEITLKGPAGGLDVSQLRTKITDDQTSAGVARIKAVATNRGFRLFTLRVVEMRNWDKDTPVYDTSRYVRLLPWLAAGRETTLEVDAKALAADYGYGRYEIHAQACFTPYRDPTRPRAPYCDPRLYLPVTVDSAAAGLPDPSIRRLRPAQMSTDPQTRELSIVGSRLLGPASAGTAHTTVRIPGLTTTALASYSKDARAFTYVTVPPDARCGAYRLELTRRLGLNAARTSHLFNLTRPFQGNPNAIVFEGEAAVEGWGIWPTPDRAASGGEALRLTTGQQRYVVFEFETPRTPGRRYLIYLRARGPRDAMRYGQAKLERFERAGQSWSTWNLTDPPGCQGAGCVRYDTEGAFSVKGLGTTKEPYRTFGHMTLEGPLYIDGPSAVTPYRLTLSQDPRGRPFPVIDMVVILDRPADQPPTNTELCF